MTSFSEAAEAAERERQLAEERASYRVDLSVFDAPDWDEHSYEDIGGFQVHDGMLVVVDMKDRTIAAFASGFWATLEVSRTDRIESTNDELKDDENDSASADQRDANLSRHGAGDIRRPQPRGYSPF